VFSYPGSPDNWRRRLWVAHLHAGPHSVISHGSAARLHGMVAVRGWPVVVSVDRNHRHALAGTRRYRAGDLDAADVTSIDGLAVTSRARTVFDLSAGSSVTRLKRLIEEELVGQTVNLAELADVLERTRRRGKPGVAKLCAALDQLGPGDGVPHSELERLLDRVIEMSGVPTPLHEQPLPSSGGVRGFVDRFWPDARLIVEADGRKWHTRRADIARDHDRDLEAARHGFLTVRMIWERLTHDSEACAAALRDVHDLRRLTANLGR
jgi:hypothetical protein